MNFLQYFQANFSIFFHNKQFFLLRRHCQVFAIVHLQKFLFELLWKPSKHIWNRTWQIWNLLPFHSFRPYRHLHCPKSYLAHIEIRSSNTPRIVIVTQNSQKSKQKWSKKSFFLQILSFFVTILYIRRFLKMLFRQNFCQKLFVFLKFFFFRTKLLYFFDSSF